MISKERRRVSWLKEGKRVSAILYYIQLATKEAFAVVGFPIERE